LVRVPEGEGFADAESCFNISISKRTNKINSEVQARFLIETHIKEIDLLFKIQSFFGGVGNITQIVKKNTSRYSVVSIKDINNFIVPHFLKYPLQSVKLIDFESWLEIINLLNSKKHLTPSGINQIISLKSIINLGLSKKMKLEYPNILILKRKEYNPDSNRLNPNWISGFIEGDGSFHIHIRKSNNNVTCFLSIGLNIREKLLLKKIQEFFDGKGKLYAYDRPTNLKKHCEFKIYKRSDLETILSHFDTYPLKGLKLKKFEIWKEITFLMVNKSYSLPENLTKIKDLNDKLKELN
jgi:LAGLIDADG endonuclease